MVKNANLTVSAWKGDTLVGLCRCLSDFAYVTYIADLAVAKDYQKSGIGKELIARTQDASGEGVKIVLLSAPSANDYYPHIGFEPHPRAWILEK
jgi:predicted N-acetyltransferase YhbS